MTDREQFEAAWCKEYPLHGTTTFMRSKLNPEAYVNTRVQDGWLMYQAALLSASKPAAKAQMQAAEIIKQWIRDHESELNFTEFARIDASLERLMMNLALAASPAAPAQSAEPAGYLYTFANAQRPHDPIKRFSTYRFKKPDSLDETIVSCVPLYAAPQPSPTAVVPYRAASDCQYVDASEEVKCAWADGWNQCAQFTKGSHDGY